MTQPTDAAARATKPWLKRHRWLLLRRFNQIGVLAMFILPPLFGGLLVTGNLSSSMTLDILPLTDPLLLAQSMLTGNWPATTGLIGAGLVLVFYAVLGGRVFCSWVCPVNMLTDSAAWLRRRLGIRAGGRLSRGLRWWLLGLVLLLPLVTGAMVWEYVNPVSMLHRGLIFGGLWGFGWAWLILVAVFVYDLLFVPRGWCGHLCPVGACYAAIGAAAPVHIAAPRRDQCDDCMDCFTVCPEPQVIKPALKGAAKGHGPIIDSIHCTKCGRCIEVCDREVFGLALGRVAADGLLRHDHSHRAATGTDRTGAAQANWCTRAEVPRPSHAVVVVVVVVVIAGSNAGLFDGHCDNDSEGACSRGSRSDATARRCSDPARECDDASASSRIRRRSSVASMSPAHQRGRAAGDKRSTPA